MNLMTEPVGLRLRGAPVEGEFDDYGNQVYGPEAVRSLRLVRAALIG
jgi:hypothetical protein